MDIAALSAAAGAPKSLADRQLIADNLDTFLQLLTTQLKNQDPLEPIDTNEFTAQLVQFSQVEQAVQSNDYLERLVGTQTLSASQAAVGYIGKVVTADGATTRLSGGEAIWAINAAGPADATFTIRDAAGSTVYTYSGQIDGGLSGFTWDGTTSTGATAPAGLYTIGIDARDASGRAVKVSTEISGVVNGVEFDGGEPMLDVGGINVRLSGVSSVKLAGP